MSPILMVRRRKLGRTSCRGIARLSSNNIKVWRNDRPCPVENTDLVIRWGCTTSVPTRNVLNTAEAIHQVNNKLAFRRTLQEAGLCPYTWFSFSEWEDSGGQGEVIVRPATHSQGRNLLVYSYHQVLFGGRVALDSFLATHPEHYVQEKIEKVAEYRVFVVQGRVACVAEKTPGNPDDVAWNVSQGGRFDNVRWSNWSIEAVRVAVEAFNLSDLDFGGVDVMVDGAGQAYVLEINSAPSLTSPYRQECMAKCFDYIIEHGKERLTTGEGYYGYLHPALSSKAL